MVSHCTCRNLPFAELKQLARAEHLSLEQLKSRTGCCTGCGMCEPYVRLMYRTGRSHFPVLDNSAVTTLMQAPASAFTLMP